MHVIVCTVLRMQMREVHTYVFQLHIATWIHFEEFEYSHNCMFTLMV